MNRDIDRDPLVVEYEAQLRAGFGSNAELTHFDELIAQGFTAQHASVAVRIAERRANWELVKRCAEVLHHIGERLGTTKDGLLLRRVLLNDDSLSQAKAAAKAGISKQALSKSEARMRERLTPLRLTPTPIMKAHSKPHETHRNYRNYRHR